jgi:hypothetical protein
LYQICSTFTSNQQTLNLPLERFAESADNRVSLTSGNQDMSNIPATFRAFRIHNDAQGYRSGIEDITIDDLAEGDVTIRVEWSSVNYKDALAATGKGKILKRYPMAGGIDVAGTVVESASDRFQPGDEVLANGSGLGENRDGGFAEYLRLQSDWVVPLPPGLTAREAMGLGTAGFTAAMCLYRMEANGQKPGNGPIVVTGASGGVGTVAIDLLTHAGYEVHAIPARWRNLIGWNISAPPSASPVMTCTGARDHWKKRSGPAASTMSVVTCLPASAG